MARTVRVAVNGYGVIGNRVADAVMLQDDMELAGVADVVSDYRIRVAVGRGYAVSASLPERRAELEAAGFLSLVATTSFVRAISLSTARRRRLPPPTRRGTKRPG